MCAWMMSASELTFLLCRKVCSLKELTILLTIIISIAGKVAVHLSLRTTPGTGQYTILYQQCREGREGGGTPLFTNTQYTFLYQQGLGGDGTPLFTNT